jgi:predicted ATPase/class 3 adenylate cyclase
MFCDLADSTALSAQLDPEDLREVLTTYQTACTKVIEGYGGFVAKFMGDGVLAYFGYPRAHEDDAEQAVRAGLALVEMVGKQITPAGEPLAARVGVATGLVIVGDSIGEGSAQEQAVVGETPNLAARLQGLARTGQVVIAETTRRLLGETFDLTDLGPQNVKGIDAPVSAFAVDVERSPGDRFEAQSGPALLPMVGRDQELALLLERWEHAKVGEGQAVLLIAEAGAAPLIARLVGVDGESKYGPINLTPQAQRTRTLDKLAHQLPGLAARQPVLVVLEDAHWIDPTTLELMEQCLDCIVGARVLILITSRPENQPRFAVHRHFTQLTLNRLGRTGIEAIIKRLSRGKTLPREVVGAIAERTDGVPLFAEELTKTILESGVLHEAAEGYELTVPLPELAIPATLHDSLMARLDRLASVKELAQTAAVIGREFTHEMIAAITQQSQSELEEGLELLIKGEIIFRRGARPLVTYSFNHALVQNAAYQSLLKSRRQQLHAQFARALEERLSETVRNEPELLAHHYSAAGITERAVLYWEKAGERAVQRSANVEAIDHLRKGLELLGTLPDTPERARQELPLQTTLGSALMAVKGQGAPETGQSYERARQLGEQVGDAEQHFRAVWGSWRYHFARSDHVQAAGLGEQCLNLAEQAQDVAFMLESRFALGASLVYQGKFVAARDSLERAISLYDIEKH